jgi:hypothetical protein
MAGWLFHPRPLRARDAWGVVAQVWHGSGGREANLTRLLAAVEVVPLDDHLGRRAGALLARTRMSDAIDAAVVLLAADGDTILTSDADDLRPLAVGATVHVDIVPV